MKICSRDDFEKVGAEDLYDEKYADNDVKEYLLCISDTSQLKFENFDMETPRRQFDFQINTCS